MHTFNNLLKDNTEETTILTILNLLPQEVKISVSPFFNPFLFLSHRVNMPTFLGLVEKLKYSYKDGKENIYPKQV